MHFHTLPLHWRRYKVFPAEYARWLTNGDSLTSRLLSVARTFHVELVRTGLARLTRDESLALDVRAGGHGYVREVQLVVDGEAVVLARSAVSLFGLKHRWGAIRSIGTRPLGETLWTNPRIERGPLEYACLEARHSLYQQLRSRSCAVHGTLPARRSVFWWNGEPLLVMEAFLPAILELPCPEKT